MEQRIMNPKLSLDAVLDRLLPWECVVTWRGVDYPIRPLAVADLGLIIQVAGSDADPAAILQFRDAIDGLFTEPKPDTSNWTISAYAAVANHVGAYLREWQVKNSQNPAGHQPAAAGVIGGGR
jgi:hypothetical protein